MLEAVPGKPDVRNFEEGGVGGNVNPLRNRKGGAGNPPPTSARASALPDRGRPDDGACGGTERVVHSVYR